MARNGKFLIGAIVGTLFGLAFAPKKGSDLRKELKDEIKTGGHGEKTLQKNAKIISKDVSVTAQEVMEDPQVKKQIAKVKKEGGKAIRTAQKNIGSTGGEWLEIAREKLMEEKAMVEKQANTTVAHAFDTIKKKVNEVVHPAKKATKPAAKKPSKSAKK